jgi:hypothetical protein
MEGRKEGKGREGKGREGKGRKEGRKGKKEGRKDGRKGGRKDGRKGRQEGRKNVGGDVDPLVVTSVVGVVGGGGPCLDILPPSLPPSLPSSGYQGKNYEQGRTEGR